MAVTISRFRILPPLYELNRANIVVPTRAGDVKLRFKLTPSGQEQAEFSGAWVVQGDDLGALHNTIVEVEFPTLLSIRPDRVPAGEPSAPPELQKSAVRLLNVVIGHYRIAARIPQIRTIALRHSAGFHYIAVDDDGTTHEGDFMTGMGLRTDGNDAGLPDGDHGVIEQVQSGVRVGEVPAWQSLYLDSLAESAADNRISALAHLYMSFEMLATMTCWSVGVNILGAEATQAFLEPPGGNRPTVYGVVKQIRRWSAVSGPSTTQLGRHLGHLWKHRNDVMHGNPVAIPDEDTTSAYEAYRAISPWLFQAAADATRTLGQDG